MGYRVDVLRNGWRARTSHSGCERGTLDFVATPHPRRQRTSAVAKDAQGPRDARAPPEFVVAECTETIPVSLCPTGYRGVAEREIDHPLIKFCDVHLFLSTLFRLFRRTRPNMGKGSTPPTRRRQKTVSYWLWSSIFGSVWCLESTTASVVVTPPPCVCHAHGPSGGAVPAATRHGRCRGTAAASSSSGGHHAAGS